MITTQQWQILLIWFLATVVSTSGYQLRLLLHVRIPRPLVNRLLMIVMIGLESSAIAFFSYGITKVDITLAFTRSMIFVGIVVIITQLDLMVERLALKKNEGWPVTGANPL